MKKRTLMVLALCFVCIGVVCASEQLLKAADDLYWADRYEDSRSLLEQALTGERSASVQAEILWRVSRAVLSIGDELKESGATKDELFAIYEEAESYARQALERDSSVAQAHVYLASSVGRWGETRGPLNSLAKASGMRDDLRHVINVLQDTNNTIAWYVMGQLYYQLPGWPISFGDNDTAISYTRKALDTIPPHILYPGHYKALAEMLWKRNLTASRRVSKIRTLERNWQKSGQTILDQHAYYEGSQGSDAKPFYSPVPLSAMSDRQEAVMILSYAIQRYESWPFHSRANIRSYEEMTTMMKDWGF